MTPTRRAPRRDRLYEATLAEADELCSRLATLLEATTAVASAMAPADADELAGLMRLLRRRLGALIKVLDRRALEQAPLPGQPSCERCGRSLSKGGGALRRYCSQSCRQRAYESRLVQRQAVTVTAAGAAGGSHDGLAPGASAGGIID